MEMWVLFFWMSTTDWTEAGQYSTEERCRVGAAMQREYHQITMGTKVRWACKRTVR